MLTSRTSRSVRSWRWPDLVESPAGALWFKRDDRRVCAASRAGTMPAVEASRAARRLARHVSGTHAAGSSAFRNVAADRVEVPGPRIARVARRRSPSPWLIVPLSSGAELVGFVVLVSPRAAIEVNWEVRDLLEDGQPAGGELSGTDSRHRGTARGAQVRRLQPHVARFVVHDLKNLVAQLSLMLQNAERHRDNPEFQRDMLTTVEHVVGRMNGLMLQLRTGTTPVGKAAPVDLEGAGAGASAAAKAGERTADPASS